MEGLQQMGTYDCSGDVEVSAAAMAVMADLENGGFNEEILRKS